MDEEVPEYIAVSSFVNQFKGDAEVSGQLMDALLRKHYMWLSFGEIMNYFPHKDESEVRSALDEFVDEGLVKDDDGEYQVDTDNQIVRGLREEQKDMLGSS